MREVFECALLQAPGLAESGDRLRLQVYDLGEAVRAGREGGAAPDTTGLIASAALALQRYDACLLYVEPANLPWARIALARARPVLRTPVLALVRDVKAAALADLLALGVADFVRMPMCPEELRARLMRLAGRTLLREPGQAYGAAPSSAAAAAPRAARPRLQRSGVNIALYDPDEPFRQAKARIVSGFERAYLCHALQRHEGNVAQAARASNKHRRAFWALMHKHAIDARAYRSAVAGGHARPPACNRPRPRPAKR
ncbi:MAG TPA: helix-turn-helix domain-containing protein [Bordetella sp.]